MIPFFHFSISDTPAIMIEIGSGLCRGPEWQSEKWPIVKGQIKAQDCANSCAAKKGCTAFDLSEKVGNKFTCFLYGHKDVEPASGVKGHCYTYKGQLISKDTFSGVNSSKNEQKLCLKLILKYLCAGRNNFFPTFHL